MKAFLSSLLVLIFSSILLVASNSPQPQYETGTILSVARRQVENPPYNGGDNPSDAPLQSQYYAYTVQVSADCGVYSAYYQSPYDYLPMQIAADNQLPVRLTKQAIYFELADKRQVKMHTIHRTRDSLGCPSQPSSR